MTSSPYFREESVSGTFGGTSGTPGRSPESILDPRGSIFEPHGADVRSPGQQKAKQKEIGSKESA